MKNITDLVDETCADRVFFHKENGIVTKAEYHINLLELKILEKKIIDNFIAEQEPYAFEETRLSNDENSLVYSDENKYKHKNIFSHIALYKLPT